MSESPSSIVYRTVAELPAGATFTSVSISRELGWNDPSLVSACLRVPKDDELIREIGKGPGRTITYTRTAMPAGYRKFKARLKAPRTMNRAPGYEIPNAGRPDLPRLAAEARERTARRRAARPERSSDPSDLFGEGGAIAERTRVDFPDAGRLDETPKVEGIRTDDKRDPDYPNFVLLGGVRIPTGPLAIEPGKERLSVRLRRMAEEIEAVEDAIERVAKNLGLGS